VSVQWNERRLRRIARAMEEFFVAGATACVRTTRRNLVKATPKRTQHAARWELGVGGPPEIVQSRKPQQTIYPLLGDAETDTQMAAEYKLGDPVVLVSRATYIKFLNRGSSKQAGANFIEGEIRAAIVAMDGWRYEGRLGF
jgi:hypothetical protein